MKSTFRTVLIFSLLPIMASCSPAAAPIASKTAAADTPAAIITPHQTDTPIQPVMQVTPTSKPVVQEAPTLKPGNTPDAVDQDEQSIYSLFLGDSAGKVVIVREETSGDSFPRDGQDTRNYITSNVSGISSETVNSYMLQNSVPAKLSASMNLGVNYVLISTPDFLEITAKSNKWDLWKQKFPNSDPSCFVFSRAGFNNAHTQALIYVTKLWVDGGYYLLDKNGGNWAITKSFPNVIIN